MERKSKMAKTNDNSTDPRDWTNRKLIATIRDAFDKIADSYSPGDKPFTEGTRALDELERRTVRSSSRN